MGKLTGLNIQANFLICVTKRHSFARQAVHLFHAKDKQVTIIIQNVFVDFDFIHNVSSHSQTVLQLIKSREEDFLNNLQIAEITRWQVIGNHHNLLRK
ncbi:hypothetical protein SDC9_182400 [bioreactor metagenome]|uniref:Uncharacterized protein n=1 Tax=bioreactor metagenome TaxID=1076179 RepID=A0A645H8R6_9ZZZZ